MTLEESSSTVYCESSTVDDSMVADGSRSIPGLGGTGCRLRLYALLIPHEISVDITDIQDIYRYLKVQFYDNISCVFQICTDIYRDIHRYLYRYLSIFFQYRMIS